MGKSKVRNPIREEKELMSKAGLIPRNWYVLKNTEEELVLVSKGAGKTRRIRKENYRRRHEQNVVSGKNTSDSCLKTSRK